MLFINLKSKVMKTGRKVTFNNVGKVVPTYLQDKAIHKLNTLPDGQKLFYSDRYGFFKD